MKRTVAPLERPPGKCMKLRPDWWSVLRLQHDDSFLKGVSVRPSLFFPWFTKLISQIILQVVEKKPKQKKHQ